MAKQREVAVRYTHRVIPVSDKTCPVCGTSFEGPVQRVYCSTRCLKQAAWQRHGKEWNANRKTKKESAS